MTGKILGTESCNVMSKRNENETLWQVKIGLIKNKFLRRSNEEKTLS